MLVLVPCVRLGVRWFEGQAREAVVMPQHPSLPRHVRPRPVHSWLQLPFHLCCQISRAKGHHGRVGGRRCPQWHCLRPRRIRHPQSVDPLGQSRSLSLWVAPLQSSCPSMRQCCSPLGYWPSLLGHCGHSCALPPIVAVRERCQWFGWNSVVLGRWQGARRRGRGFACRLLSLCYRPGVKRPVWESLEQRH